LLAFFCVWPEFVGSKSLPRLTKWLRDGLEQLPAKGAPQSMEARLVAIEWDIGRGLRVLLSTADDARLERALSAI